MKRIISCSPNLSDVIRTPISYFESVPPHMKLQLDTSRGNKSDVNVRATRRRMKSGSRLWTKPERFLSVFYQ